MAPRTLERLLATRIRRAFSLRHRGCFTTFSNEKETSAWTGSFATSMKPNRELDKGPELDTVDRRVIRVDIPAAHAGITAALRRAFEAAASEPCDRDFAELLRKLN